MADLVGGALLSSSFQVLFETLTSPELVNYLNGKKRHGNFNELRERLECELRLISAVLEDAELKQIRSKAVEEWMDQCQEAVFEADDLVDDIKTEALRLKVEAESSPSISTKVRKFFLPSNISYDRDLECRMKMCILG